jgi:hypothetical protein
MPRSGVTRNTQPINASRVRVLQKSIRLVLQSDTRVSGQCPPNESASASKLLKEVTFVSIGKIAGWIMSVERGDWW